MIGIHTRTESKTLTLDINERICADVDVEYAYDYTDPDPSVGLPNGTIEGLTILSVEIVHHGTGERLDITNFIKHYDLAKSLASEIEVDA